MKNTVKLLENIIFRLPNNIFWKDINGKYIWCNNEHLKALGLESLNDIIGKTDQDLAWKGQAEQLHNIDAQVLKTGKEFIAEEKVTLATGKEEMFLSKKIPLKDVANNSIGVLGVAINITDLKNTQDALVNQIKETEKAYHLKSEFLSVTTHEIRNPVGNITIFDAFLKKNLDKLKNLLPHENSHEINEVLAKITEQVNFISHESHKALDYLKCLGQIHHLETEKLRTDLTEINIKSIINSISKGAKPYNIANAKMIAHIDASVPEYMHMDFMNIDEALKIIASNAVRFSEPDGTVEVNINTGKSKNRLVITVRDYGTGISDLQIQQLFEKNNGAYPQTNAYRKPSLRLTIAKMLIEASGGKLKIERLKDEKGTKVTVFLPYESKQNHNQNQKSQNFVIEDFTYNATPSLPDFKKRHALVIEDDPDYRLAEKTMIEELGHSVDLAATGEEALDKLTRNHYDIIFLDITLPDMSGVDIMKKIRHSKNKALKDIRIIVISSHSNSKDIACFEAAGATLVLPKPVTQEQFKGFLSFEDDAEED